MPKGFSDDEKKIIRKSILKNCAILIREKGLRKTTVEDVTKRSGISKGSFYAFFNSREELFVKLIDEYEKEFVNETIKILSEEGNNKEKVVKAMYKLFLSNESIVFYLDIEDIVYLNRCAPERSLKDTVENAKSLYKKVFDLCKKELSSLNLEIASLITRTIQLALQNPEGYSNEAKEVVIAKLVDVFAEFMTGD